MIKIKPKFAYDDKGQKVGVVLTPKDFELMIDGLEDYHDYQFFQKRKKKKSKEKTYTLEEVMAEYSRKQ